MDIGILLLIALAFVFVLGSYLFRTVAYGSLKGALFGAQVGATVGELPLASQPGHIGQTTVRVHVLEPAGVQFRKGGRGGGAVEASGPEVGLEILFKSAVSWQVRPVSLTAAEARRLAHFLEEAADRPRRSPG